MTPAEANTLVDLILEAHLPSTASWGARVLEYGRAERSGAPERVARALAELYAEASLTPAQELMVRRLEDRLLPEMAAALEEPLARLRARLHGEREIFAGEASYVAEETGAPEAVANTDVVGPRGWEALHSFRVFGGALVIGQAPDDVEGTLTLAARDGDWHVFRVPPAGGFLRSLFTRPTARLVVVHDGALAGAERALDSTRALAATEGRSPSIVDAAARRDPRIKALIHNLEGSAGASRSSPSRAPTSGPACATTTESSSSSARASTSETSRSANRWL